MPTISFPNVPKFPGVPLIPRSPDAPPSLGFGIGVIESVILRAFQVNSTWGIYDEFGKPLGEQRAIGGVLGAVLDTIGGIGILGIGINDNTLSTNDVQYSKETRVSDFPIERGKFASYNKVEMPASPVVTLCFSGNERTRAAFLNAIDGAVKSTGLYTVVTPEVRYLNYSIERYAYSRRSYEGATLLKVELSLKEIRSVSAVFSTVDKPKDPGSAPPADGGKVQATTPPVSTLNTVIKKLPNLGTYLRGLLP